jgi:hypothetical protein
MYLFFYLVVLLVSWCALGLFLYMAAALVEMKPATMTVTEALEALEADTSRRMALIERQKEKIRNATLPELRRILNHLIEGER